MEDIIAIILAAGEGKRMKSKYSKVAHKVYGKPLIEWVYQATKDAGINNIIAVVGHREDQVRECLQEKVKYVTQEQQLGTGHAVKQTLNYLEGKKGHVLILCGDTPLITSNTISKFLEYHKNSNNNVTIISTELDDATGYGRIIRDKNENVIRIIEHKDASDDDRKISEVNSGIYCFCIDSLLQCINQLNNDNLQGEYYLTDTLQILFEKGEKVGALKIHDSNEIIGINDRIQLAEASDILRKKILDEHMKNGVTIIDPSSTFIDSSVEIGIDTIIYPFTIIEGASKIGEGCIIGPNSRVVNSIIRDNVEVNNSVLLHSTVDSNTHIGPFAYLRPDSSIGKSVKIGDFVEIKKSSIGDNTKISHLSYVGDSEVGENVNIGCGTVVVNYDGKNKYKTFIGDNAFIGCNTNLISPVEVKKNSYIAAGSTITQEVPENALAIARSRQVIKENWVINKGLKNKK